MHHVRGVALKQNTFLSCIVVTHTIVLLGEMGEEVDGGGGRSSAYYVLIK